LVQIGLDWKWTNEIMFSLRSLASHIHEIFNGCSQSNIVLMEVDGVDNIFFLVQTNSFKIVLGSFWKILI